MARSAWICERVAANLRRLRHEKGLSQDDLAYEAEVSETIEPAREGRLYASLKIIGRLAEALGVEPAELLKRGAIEKGAVNGKEDKGLYQYYSIQFETPSLGRANTRRGITRGQARYSCEDKCLNVFHSAQIERYWEEGCVFPIRVMSEADAAELRAGSKSWNADRRTPQGRSAPQIALAVRLARRTRAAKRESSMPLRISMALICCAGPLTSSSRRRANPAFVSWHQDSTYWGLSRPDVVTAWVAFTEATRQRRNGIHPWQPQARPDPPSRHLRQEQSPHARAGGRRRGGSLQREIITLRPGEMSLHHVRLVHGSPPNPSNDRRIGFAIRYIPTSVAQVAGEDSATLVRGEDRSTISRSSRNQAAISIRILALHQHYRTQRQDFLSGHGYRQL